MNIAKNSILFSGVFVKSGHANMVPVNDKMHNFFLSYKTAWYRSHAK